MRTPEQAIAHYKSRSTINDRGCWVYSGGLATNGYALVSFNMVQRGLHRWSWVWHNGAIPDDTDVLHKCNNKACWNPDHLFLGDQTTNTADAYRDGLIALPRGSSHPRAKLTEEDVKLIRLLRASGEKISELCRTYEMSRYAMCAILNRKTWTHI